MRRLQILLFTMLISFGSPVANAQKQMVSLGLAGDYVTVWRDESSEFFYQIMTMGVDAIIISENPEAYEMPYIACYLDGGTIAELVERKPSGAYVRVPRGEDLDCYGFVDQDKVHAVH